MPRSKSRTRGCIFALFTFLFTLALLEGGLQLFDPLGVLRYHRDQRLLGTFLIDHPTHWYVLAPGIHEFSNWTLHILDDHTRAVPHTDQQAACTVALLGDSITFAFGVSDEQTWADQAARQLPGVRLSNIANSGYNSEQIRETWKEYRDKADGFIYLVIYNDPYGGSGGRGIRILQPSAVNTYIRHFYATYLLETQPEYNWPRFYDDLDQMTADERVVLVAFDDEFGRDLAQRYNVRLIPPYQHAVSAADSHPNERGHQEIAEAMLTIIQQAARELCP